MIDLVPAVVAETLLATPPLLRTLLAPYPPEVSVWQPDADTWSIKQVIGHLIAVDAIAFADRIQLMLDEEQPTIPAIDVNQLATERQDQHRAFTELLDELAEQRQQHAALVRSLTSDQLARIGHYAKHGDFCIRDFVYEWAYHDHAHVQQVIALLKQAIWPHFSTTMQRALDG